MTEKETLSAGGAGGERVVWNHCAINCPGRCALKIFVRDDEVVRVETYAADTLDLDDPQPRACQLGRSYRAWFNHPDRINYPLRRVAGTRRGEGVYERIGWDEAVKTIASELRRVIDAYGNQAVYINYCTGQYCTTQLPFRRLMNILGGYLGYYGDYSQAQNMWIAPYMFGGGPASTLSAARDADLVLVFGSSPTETRQGGAVSHRDWVRLREGASSAKVYVVDPRMNDSLLGHSEQWLPVNPGTDAALISALAHELIVNDQVDLDFLHTYCVGYDEQTMSASARGRNLSYRSYIMGEGYDLVEKTPEWAAPICGVAPGRIRELAGEIAAARRMFVVQGWGPQRRSNGEMTSAAICMLPLLTGNVGLPGTSTGLREAKRSFPIARLPFGENPVKVQIPVFLMADAVDHGRDMTAYDDGVVGAERLGSDIKLLINWAGNCITNQNGNVNRVHDIMADESKCEFIFGSDVVMTDSMKYCDVILPDLFRAEQYSMNGSGGDDPFIVAGTPCTCAKYERKGVFEACTLIARELGVEEQFTEGRTEREWIEALYEQTRAMTAGMPSYEELLERGVYAQRCEEPLVALEDFRRDPEAHPLPTPSGKIEIYSEALAEFIATHRIAEDDFVAPVPVYAPEWYGVHTLCEERPLMLTGFHYRGRIHSSWGNVGVVREANPQVLWMNPADAAPRGIADGDLVRVQNEFGATELPAKVTPRVVPGCVAMPQGAWHDADMDGDRVDRGGCINVLTTHRPSPLAKGNPQHTNVCQVVRVEQSV